MVDVLGGEARAKENHVDEHQHFFKSGVVLQEELTQRKALLDCAARFKTELQQLGEGAIELQVLVVQLLAEVA